MSEYSFFNHHILETPDECAEKDDCDEGDVCKDGYCRKFDLNPFKGTWLQSMSEIFRRIDQAYIFFYF